MDKNKNLAFTLAELLTAVLVISVIMVALAPVITKRMKESISVQTDNKKGLEIYTNPGTYTFDVPIGINTLFIQGSGGGGGGGGSSYIDKEISFNTIGTQTWIVPRGVNQITFTITGSGGGGGGGYAKTQNVTCQSGTNKLSYLADNGKDLCVTSWMNPPNTSGFVGSIITVPMGTNCHNDACCWQDNQGLGRRTVCTYMAAYDYCIYSKSMRLITNTEMQRIVNTKSLGSSKLNACASSSQSGSIPNCPALGGAAPGSVNNNGWPYWIWLAELYAVPLYNYYSDGSINMPIFDPTSSHNVDSEAYTVFCAIESESWIQYSGAGGNSGAKYTRTISVLPEDKISIVINSGGNGGAAGANGTQGAVTKLVHYDKNSVLLGEYSVKGGLGGKKATSSTNGSSIEEGNNSNQTTPEGMCHIKYKTNRNSSTYTELNPTCTSVSYSGKSGTQYEGGIGGTVDNQGTGTKGGGLDINNGTGYSATSIGFGGGGGSCKRGVRNPNSCQSGGKGANGKINISYRIMLPGGGGGAATRVGGSKVVSEKNTDYEIKYKIQEGTRLVFQIGAGGTGGLAGQNGTNGQPTTISGNKIIFLAGEGGKTVTSTQKNNLSSCIGTTTNSTTIKNCINNSSYKAQGGKSSYVSTDSALVNNSTGLITNDSGKISYTISTSFKGNSGKTGAQSYNIIPYTYGFDGGTGGAPFGIRSNSIVASISCGGGISGTYGSTTDANAYLCTSGSPDGNSARSHDPVNNEFGGSGGGGAGAVGDSFEQGSGGNGSSGYLRIRWDMSEQE